MIPRTPTLLLIEDFSPDRELYRRYLGADGDRSYRLLEAETAKAGLELCRTEAIDAILLDYLLPDANGLQFLESLRDQSNGDSPPVVMVTGEGDETVAVRAMKLGAEDYLTKRRLTPELLQLTMRSAIENARLRLQLRQSDDRFRISVENLLDCFSICSTVRNERGQIVDFRIDYLNTAALASNQMTPADIGRLLCEVFPAHRDTGLFEEYCRVVETGEPLSKEELIYSDVFGTQYLTRAFDIRVSRLQEGIVLAWRDVTDRKQAELDRQQQLERERILNQITQQLRRFPLGETAKQPLDPWEILNLAVAEVRQFLKTDRALVYRFDPDFSGSIIAESVGEGWMSTLNTQIEDTCFIKTQDEDFRPGRVLMIEDTASTESQIGLLERFQVRAYLIVPILQGEALWGLLMLHQCAHPRQWQSSEVELLQQIAAQISIAVQQTELYQQVEQKQQFIQQISDAAPGFLYIYDLIEHRNIYSNRGIVDVLGYTPEEIQAMGEAVLPQLFHPDDFAQVPDRIAKLQTSQPGENFESEFRLRHANGEWRWFGARETAYRRNSAGVVYQILGVAQEITGRKQVEALLRQSQERLELSLTSSQQGIWDYDIATDQAYWSPQCKRLFGLEPDDHPMSMEQFLNCVHLDDRDRVWAAVQALYHKNQNYDIEYRVPWADGSVHWLHAKGKCLRDEQGNPRQNIGTVVEISDRKRLEAELQQRLVDLQASQQRYQQLADAMPQMVWSADATGRVNYWNQQWYKYTGLGEAESMGLAGANAIHPEDRNRTLERWNQAVAQGTSFEIEHRIRRWDGVYHWFINRGIVTRDDQGQVTDWIGTVTDIDELKRSQTEREQLLNQLATEQQRLQQSEERLQLGIQVAGIALARVDYLSNTVTLSPEAATLYGISADERTVTREHTYVCPRERLRATLHPDDRDKLARLIEQVLDPSGSGWFADKHRVVWQNGEVRWLDVRKQVFFDHSTETPRPVYAILAAIDITEREHAEQEREQLFAQAEAARAEAEAANRGKDEFVSLVAHELRSPLNAILGWAKLLQTRQFDEAAKTKALETIARNAQTQAQLVEDLLDVSRMARGSLRLTMATVNLHAVVEAAVETVHLTAQSKGLQLETQIQAASSITGDFQRLQQVVINLLTNAIKFTPEGGRVQVLLEQQHSDARIQVSDTGKGISPELLPRIFERFQQDQQSTTTKQGLGLGLAIVKYIVEQHGGTITAESRGEGQGATFTVLLPLSQ